MGKKSTPKKKPRNQSRSGAESEGGGELASWFKDEISRRSATQRLGKGLIWTSAIGMAGATIVKVASDDDEEITFDSLELQRREGWNVGSTERQLNFPALTAVTQDSLGRTDWNRFLEPVQLIAAYQPSVRQWQPFLVPTLMQSLAQTSLRSQIRPVVTQEMRETYERAGGLKELLSQAENASSTLIIADLPGPSSVALGAALAEIAQIIPTYDNWPHPLGVVPSHETLGALVYYAAEVEAKKPNLKEASPPVLLLDSRRLTAYRDEATQFDNRYLAKIPPANELKMRMITNLIYLVRDQSQREELDDLNDDFVELQKNGINIRLLRLSDFKPFDEEVTAADPTQAAQTARERHYYYGGSPATHWWFYNHYYYRPYREVYVNRGGRSVPLPRPATRPTFQAPSYRPISRPTIFSAARVGGASGVGRARPSGFGRTSVRVSNGRVTGTRAGRSGSYGRSGGSWFGG